MQSPRMRALAFGEFTVGRRDEWLRQNAASRRLAAKERASARVSRPGNP